MCTKVGCNTPYLFGKIVVTLSYVEAIICNGFPFFRGFGRSWLVLFQMRFQQKNKLQYLYLPFLSTIGCNNTVSYLYGTIIGMIGVKYDKQDRLVSCPAIISNCRRAILWKLRNWTVFVFIIVFFLNAV